MRGRQRETERWKEEEELAASCLPPVPAGVAQQWPFTGTPPQRQLIPVCTFPSLCRYPLVRDLTVFCGPEAVAPAKLPSKLLKPNNPNVLSVPQP